MSGIRCFWLEPTDQVEESLRRYSRAQAECQGCSYHNADVAIGRRTRQEKDAGADSWPHDDSRWPKQCACGYVFQEHDYWQYNPHSLFRRADTGELMTLGAAPVGAMWNASWLADNGSYRGPDGRSLVVRTPGGDWVIDSRASNCAMKDDDVHKCWVRHGEPPDLTVDKNGHTCAAGAGSIMCGSYHGFLRGGHLVPA